MSSTLETTHFEVWDLLILHRLLSPLSYQWASDGVTPLHTHPPHLANYTADLASARGVTPQRN